METGTRETDLQEEVIGATERVERTPDSRVLLDVNRSDRVADGLAGGSRTG